MQQDTRSAYDFFTHQTALYFKMRNQLKLEKCRTQSVKYKPSKLAEVSLSRSCSNYYKTKKMMDNENLPTNFHYDQEKIMISMGSQHGRGHDDNIRGG